MKVIIYRSGSWPQVEDDIDEVDGSMQTYIVLRRFAHHSGDRTVDVAKATLIKLEVQA